MTCLRVACLCEKINPVSTLLEIESAVTSLPPYQQRTLLVWLQSLVEEKPQVDTEPSAAQSFVSKWSGKGRLLAADEMVDDPRLAELTAKHVH